MNKLEATAAARLACLDAQEIIQTKYHDKTALQDAANTLNNAGRSVALTGSNPVLLAEISKLSNRAQLILNGQCLIEITKPTFRHESDKATGVELVGNRSTSYTISADYLHYGLRTPFADTLSPDQLAQLQGDIEDESPEITAHEMVDVLSINFRNPEQEALLPPSHNDARIDLLRTNHPWFSTESTAELSRRAQSAPNKYTQRKKALGLFWRLEQLYGEILEAEVTHHGSLPTKSLHFTASVQGSRNIKEGRRPNLTISGKGISVPLKTEAVSAVESKLGKTVKEAQTAVTGRQKLLSVASKLGIEL